MKIKLSSVLVDNQAKALKFYTKVLGFVKKTEIPMGKYRWLTVVSPDAPEGTELVLEPDANPAAKTFKKALLKQGIPYTAFEVDDIAKEYQRMKKLKVRFAAPPASMGAVIVAKFHDTCGNLIQLYELNQNQK
jgi:catechol 2,3-dioxygenase-like lactoylglutathione lyase family enzyme